MRRTLEAANNTAHRFVDLIAGRRDTRTERQKRMDASRSAEYFEPGCSNLFVAEDAGEETPQLDQQATAADNYFDPQFNNRANPEGVIISLNTSANTTPRGDSLDELVKVGYSGKVANPILRQSSSFNRTSSSASSSKNSFTSAAAEESSQTKPLLNKTTSARIASYGTTSEHHQPDELDRLLGESNSHNEILNPLHPSSSQKLSPEKLETSKK